MAAAPATNPIAKRSRRKSQWRPRAVGRRFALATVLAASAVASAGADPPAIARGAYLAAAAGCDQCHTDTKNNGPPYGGGRELAGEFGAITTPNLTPDLATGLGGWSDADFTRAMRWGIAPDGSHYAPAFPFRFYARLTDADLTDLRAFFTNLAPVTRPGLGAASGLALLQRARAAIANWVAGVPHPWQIDPSRDPAIERGAYLVATIGRCEECHTPVTWLGLPDETRTLAGSHGRLSGRKAPNITPDPKTGIGNWSPVEITSFLRDGGLPDGDFVGGAMAEIVRGTAHLTDADRQAIAAYLKSLPPKTFDKND
jgi:mono/diheme cytochrome c family protein